MIRLPFASNEDRGGGAGAFNENGVGVERMNFSKSAKELFCAEVVVFGRWFSIFVAAVPFVR